MRVRVIQPGSEVVGAPMTSPVLEAPTPRPPSGASGPWRPAVIVGAASAAGLLLPEAQATPSTLYAPRGVFLDGARLVVSDTGNHRVLLFDGVPQTDRQSADVVLGQPDAFTEGPQAGGAGPEAGMNLPTGVLVTDDGRLVVADAWNHRILVWDDVPRAARPPDIVLGQPDAASTEPNAGHGPDASVFYWPFGVAVVDGRFYVADTGNRRVLGWRDGVPDPGRPADLVLGQPDAHSRQENRGTGVAADTFRWPHAMAGAGGGLLVADAGNHRVLGWRAHPDADRPADVVLGQPDFLTADEFPYRPQTATGLRFPYAVHHGGHGLAVADTANNRILLWDRDPRGSDAAPSFVLGQPTFSANGENRWESVERDTLCWPYGIWQHGDRIAIADSGNNRVVIWSRS